MKHLQVVIPRLAVMPPSSSPDFGALGADASLGHVVGALLTYGLLTAVLMVIMCAAMWAVASAQGSWHAATKAKTGLLVALSGAVLIGGSLAWANWLLDLGAQL